MDLAGRHLASPTPRRWLRLAFVLVLGRLIIAIAFTRAGERPFEGATIASLAAAGFGILAFRRAESRVVGYAVKLCLIVAPLPPVLFAQMLGWKSGRECGELTSGPTAASNARPVFVLLFDGWSLERSTASSEFLPALARLRRLAETSFVSPNTSAQCHPFMWTATADSILAKIERLCKLSLGQHTSPLRQWTLIKAIKHVEKAGIPAAT